MKVDSSAVGQVSQLEDWRELRRRLREVAAALDEALARAAPAAETLLSIVSPVYQAEGLIDELIDRIAAAVSPITDDFEIVLVDDGSSDGSWRRIAAAAAREPRLKGVRLSRNFGQHYAITAGLDHARGRWVVVMDCDLQDDPVYIPALYQKALEGYHVVYAVREGRAHGRLRNASSRLFARALRTLSTAGRSDPRIGNYTLISREVVTAFRRFADVHRHYLMLLRWLGFPAAEVPIRHAPRPLGRSSYSWRELTRHAADGVTAYSDRLPYFGVAVGFVLLAIALAGATGLVVAYYLRGFKEGWTSVAVLILLTASAVLLTTGVVGIYVGKIFDQVRRRPLYVVQSSLNCPPVGDPDE
jgi:dolichol-phosphate mannosyltransferase